MVVLLGLLSPVFTKVVTLNSYKRKQIYFKAFRGKNAEEDLRTFSFRWKIQHICRFTYFPGPVS